MESKNKDVPLFIKNRGCINCKVSKASQEKHGAPYVADHELRVGCIIFGCVDYGYSLCAPFMDPEEGMALARKTGNSEYRENVRKYCAKNKERFGAFYDRIGISLDKIME